MKLHYAPGTCAMGIHILLAEIGRPYELARIDLKARDQHSADYLALNPKAKVPVLERDDGSVLTQFPAIATWLALTNPGAHLLPQGPDGLARALETVDYVASTLHMHAFSRMFHPAKYAPSEADHEAVKAQGREMADAGFALMDAKLAASDDYVNGPFSIADAALFYVEYWATRLDHPVPERCAAHFARMKERPSVQTAMREEGIL